MSAFQSALAQLLAPQSDSIRDLTNRLIAFMEKTTPQLSREVKLGWKNITYSGNKTIFAIQPYSQYVSLHFYRGIELPDPQGLLEGSGKKLRHVKIHKPEDIRDELLLPLLQEAIDLDQRSS